MSRAWWYIVVWMGQWLTMWLCIHEATKIAELERKRVGQFK